MKQICPRIKAQLDIVAERLEEADREGRARERETERGRERDRDREKDK